MLHLEFLAQPSKVMADSVLRPPVLVQVKDAGGQPYTGNALTVSVMLSNPNGARLGGTTTRTTVNGVAAFSDLTIDKAGSGFNLQAAASGTNAPPGNTASAAFDVVPQPVLVDTTRLTLISDSTQQANGVLVYTVTGLPPDLKPGSIVAGPEGGGYLRKVKTTSVSGSTLTVTTDSARLTDAVREGSIRSTTPISFGERPGPSRPINGVLWAPATVSPLLPGVTVENGEIVLDDVTLWDGGADVLKITEGRIAFAPQFDLSLELADWKVRELEVKVGGNVTFNADVQYKISGSFSRKLAEIPIARIEKPFLAFIGAWPVWGRVTLTWQLVPEIGANGALTVETGVEASGGLSVGARYANGAWAPIVDPTASFAIKPITVVARAAGYAVVGGKAEVRLTLYEVAGPYVWAEPYIRGDVSADIGANQWHSSCTSAIKAGVGVAANIVGYEIADYSTEGEFLKSSWPGCDRNGQLVAITVAKQSGDNQTAEVGQPLSAPLAVTVTGAGGAPLAGQTVSFAAAGGGKVAPATAVTDQQGRAQTTWTLGTAIGSQHASATVSGALGSPVTFSATAKAVTLRANPTDLSFTAIRNGPLPPSQPVSLGASSGTLSGLTASINYSQGNDWLTATLSGPSTPATLTLGPKTTALQEGTYTATVTAAATGGSSATVTVHYTVVPPADPLVVTKPPANITATGLTMTGTVTPQGQTPVDYWFEYAVNTTTCNPFTALPTRQLVNGATTAITVTDALVGGAPGMVISYRLNAARAGGTVQRGSCVTATLDPGTLQASPTSRSFSAIKDGPTPQSQSVNLTAGTGLLSGLSATISYQSGNGWLAATLSGTSTPAVLTMVPNTTALTPATYRANVTVTAAGGAAVSITVTYVVTTPIDPLVVSQSASNITTTSLTMNGTVNPQGQAPVDYWFEYAVNTGSCSPFIALPTRQLVNGASTAVSVTDGLVGGTPAMVISYRLSAARTGGAVQRGACVTATLLSGTLQASPTSRTFTAPSNGATPPSQPVTLTASVGTLTGLSPAISYQSGSGWLAATLSATSTPATLTLVPTTTALPPGTYSANVTTTASGGASVTVAVTYTVTSVDPVVVTQAPTNVTTTGL
ncbi:MAG: Ig-like domain-containing protein, partial [Gemmatimonadota bacterium]